jgi:hypothetical protein
LVFTYAKVNSAYYLMVAETFFSSRISMKDIFTPYSAYEHYMLAKTPQFVSAE